MILVTNIGNRNFTYQGEPVARFLQGKKTTFREFTKSLVLGNQEDQIEIAILDSILRQSGRGITEMYLIATNQKKGSHRDQDTHYAAELIKRKMATVPEWSHINVHIEELPLSIERTAEVMNWYKRMLTTLYREHPGDSFLICDAGGAPQMKTPLKIMAEFILPADSFQVQYVVQQTGEVIDVDQMEYRRVLAIYQIESLVSTLNYRAAIELWRGITGLPEDKDNVLLLLKFAAARAEMLFEDAASAAHKAANRMKDSKVDLTAYASKALSQKPDLRIKEEHIFQAQEYLALCDYAMNHNHLNQMVLHARQFQEYMLAALIEDYIGIPLLSDYSGASRKLPAYAKSHAILLGDKPITTDSVPARMAIANSHPNKEINPWIESFQRTEYQEQKGLGPLRNSLVHEGKSITSKKLVEFCPELTGIIGYWKNLLKFPKVNPFELVNSEVIRLMKR